MAVAFISPSRVQEPAKISIFFSSGPGLGASFCANADRIRIRNVAEISAMDFIVCLTIFRIAECRSPIADWKAVIPGVILGLTNPGRQLHFRVCEALRR